MSGRLLTIDGVNAMDLDTFVTTFGHVYESTPELAHAAWGAAPFADRSALVTAFAAVVADLDDAHVLALLRAHPQLATAGPMTDDSRDEQRSAGLRDLDADTAERIRAGNAAYAERFGFPFIIAVRGLGPADIAAALEDRLAHDAAEEQATARDQVTRIAELRIAQVVAP